ncbi:vacuolating cytotoxin domain-containing protein [Helicobacter salomonis]|uniref:vacuolating cytotoxin domain-containing protein n=1 Tax=Helicobacter salomonis TaxID=56878 RepID=UPI000CF1265E|nr:vacuolating cytotoxin domain-containing protein [Helicobacter salomonis]
MKQVHPLTLKLSHAVAKRIKANQSQRAQLYAFSPRVFEPPRPNPPKRPLVIPKLAPLPKGASKAGALLAGALLAGGPLKAAGNVANAGPLNAPVAMQNNIPQPLFLATVLPIVKSENVWGTVYNLGSGNFSVGDNGIAYINPGNTTIGTYTSWIGGKSFNVNVNWSNNVSANDQATLVLGNQTPNVATGGTIWIPHGSIGPIWGNFRAPNIYMTNTYKTGVASGSGKGVMGFDAAHNLTMDGLTYVNEETIAGGRALGSGPRSSAAFKALETMNITKSNFVDNTWGSFGLKAKDTTLTNSSFTGFHSTIDLSADQQLQATDTQFNNAYGGTTVKGDGGVTLKDVSFSGQNNKVSLSSTSGALNVSNTQFSGSHRINVSANSASFNKTTFNTTGNEVNTFKTNTLNFTNTTWTGSTNYQFNSSNGGTSTNTTFSGTTNINTDGNNISPFAKLQGIINLSPGAILNISQDLKANMNYTLFSPQGVIKAGGQELNNKDLWNYLEFRGMGVSSVSGDIATYDFKGIPFLRIKGDLSGGKLTLTPLTGYANVWPYLYNFTSKDIDVGDGGIAYVDPGLGTLQTWSQPVGNRVVNININQNGNGASKEGTLVFGNGVPMPASGGQILFGKDAWVGYITANLKAPNIYLTNSILTGNDPKVGDPTGGGATLNFTANKNIVIDQLDYFNKYAGLQDSNGNFTAGDAISITNSSFADQTNDGGFHFVSNNGTITMQNSGIGAKYFAFTANQANFSGTSFSAGAQGLFKANSLNFENTTWVGIAGVFKFQNKNSQTLNTDQIHFSGVTSIDSSGGNTSPLANLNVPISLSNGALFNIDTSLAMNQAYTILENKDKMTVNGQAFSMDNFWNITEFHGVHPSSVNGNSATFSIGGVDFKMTGKLENNKFTISLDKGYQDIWPSVYCMVKGGIVWSYCYKHPPQYNFSVGDGGIAYINPNAKNSSAPYWNSKGNFLNTYSFTGQNITYDIQGNNSTLIIGNNVPVAATGGTIQFGKAPNLGYVKDTFKAGNIFLTNAIDVGTSTLSGGGGYMTFEAQNNITADGLNYHNYITAIPPFNSAVAQQSQVYLIGQNINIANSSFADDSSGVFSFSGKQAVSFDQSSLRGYGTTVTIDTPKATLTGTSFFLGNGTNFTLKGSGTSTALLSGSTINLSQQSSANFTSNTLNIERNSALWLSNESKATISGTANVGSVSSVGNNGAPNIDNSVINLNNGSTLNFQGATKFFGAASLSVLNQDASAPTQAIFAQPVSFADNTVVSVSSIKGGNSQVAFQGDATFSGEATLGINGENAQAIFSQNATFSGISSLVLSDQAKATIKGTTELDDGVNINLAGASTLDMQALNLNGADVALMGQSQLIAGDTTSTGNSAFYSTGDSALTFGNFNLNGILTLKGILTPNLTTPYMTVKGAFNVGNTGLLNISNVDIFTALPYRASKVYDIINTTQGFQGISGADGYQKIDFYNMKIKNATYDATQNSWSFANPLNGAQTITESLQNNKLVVTISQSAHPVQTSLFNIAPELYYYKQSRQNIEGSQYDYGNDASGTFFLDSNLKGVFIPPTTSQTQTLNPQTPGTYGAYNQPLDPLHIYNPAITQANLSSLYNLASGLWPQLESLLKSGVLSNLNDPTKVMQALENAHVTLTPEQKQELTDLIGGLSARINQTFENGTLVVGGTQVGTTQSDSVIWFGGNGYADPCSGSSSCQDLRSKNLGQLLEGTSVGLGYIDANFNAKDIYITGTLGSGNAWQTGGSASVSFNSASNLVLNDATITAEGTDQIFPLLGQAGFYKILGQAGLGHTLGNIIYQKAQGNALVPSSIQNLGGLLPPGIANKPLGDLFSAQNLGTILELPGMVTIIKDILSNKTVSSLLGSDGLIANLSPASQNKIYNAINKNLPLGGAQTIQDLANGLFGPRTLLNLIGNLSPMTHMGVDQILNIPNTPQGTATINNMLNNTTFGKALMQILTNQDIINKSVAWLGPQILGSMMDVAIQNILNPQPALTKMLANTTAKLLNQLLGPELLNTLNQLSQQKDLQAIANAIMQDKGLGGLWSRGLGSVLSDGLQKQLKEVGVGNLLAPKGLSWLWEKGYFSFMGAQNVFVNNSKFSNATGGALSFVAGDKIVFNGTNSIDFTNYAGTLNFFSNNQSDIEVSTLNATNGLNINAQFNNVTVKAGTLTTNNEYEGINVSALNFNYLGTIEAKGGKVDLSAVTGKTLLGTINLAPNTSLLANNLSIKDALNNASTRIPIQPQTSPNQPPPSDSAVQIAQDFTLYSGATLTTNPSGINVGGAFSSQGSMFFNAGAQNANTPFIDVKGIATLKPTADTPSLSLNTQANNAAYTLVQAKWIDYNLYNKPFNPNSWKDYLSLYTQLSVNGGRMELNARGDGLVYNGKAVDIANRGLSVSYENAQGQKVTSSIAYNNIQVGVGKQPDIVVPTIQEYIQQIQGSSSVQAVYKAGGPRVMEWLSALLVDTKNTPLFAPYYLENNSSATLVKMAKDIANSIDLIASPSLKNNSTDILQLNTYTQQMSRLAKLSNFTASVPTFHDFLEDIKGERFASAVPNAMDVILAYSQRDKIKNNLWMQGVGGASFVAGGTGTLYGINVGYDRFVKGAIVGGYVAYAYSGFHGNIVNANSNNVNVGLYSRIFAKNSEITLSANETWGYNKNYVNAANPILSIVNQRYKYNTWTTNVGVNYGYDFFFKNKSVVLKPQIAMRYYYIGLSSLQGIMDNPIYDRFKANADPNKKSVLTLNVALESRHYFGKNSYYFVIADIGRDLFVHSLGDKLVRFIGNNTLSYRKGGLYNTFASLTMGGEVRLWKSLYVNAGIGARFGLDYQDINITGNMGMRYAF